MRLPILILLSCIYSQSFAQTFDANSNHIGILKTTEGKFEGNIDLDLETSQVMCKGKNATSVYGARQIKSLEFTDDAGKQYRYKSYELEGKVYLFEVLSEGKVCVLFREGIEIPFTDEHYPSYFIKSKKDQLVPVYRKKDLMEAFGDDAKWMAQYIKNQDVDLDQFENISLVFDYYNSTYEASHP